MKQNQYATEMLKLEATARHEEFEEKRKVYSDVVRWQPQYLNEGRYVPYLFNGYLKQERSVDTFEDHIRFNLTDIDRLIFPELKQRKTVKLQTFNGKVREL